MREQKMLTTREFAARHGVSYFTVMSWLRRQWIPGVQKTELPSGGWYYLIPEDAPRPMVQKGPKPQLKPELVKSLDALRKFGGEKLSLEEKEAIARAHADHFFDLAKTAHQKLFGSEQNTWLDRLDYEYDNLRTALDYYSNNESAAVQELEMAVFLGRFWDVRGHWAEGIQTLERAIARQQPGNSALKAKGLAWVGLLLLSQDNYGRARLVLTESITMGRMLNDKEALALALHSLGVVTEAQGHYQEAKSILLESLKWSQEASQDWLSGWNFRWLGTAAEAEGDYASARDFYTKYLSVSEKIQHVGGIAGALDNLGVIARQEGDYLKARQHHEKSLALRQGLGNRLGMSYCYFNLGLVEEAIGQHQAACSSFQNGLILCQEVGDRRGSVRAMEGIAKMANAIGREEDAARIYGGADTLRISIAAPLSPSEQKNHGQVIAAVKEKFPSAWQDGSRWPLDEAITFALAIGTAG